MDNAKRHNEGKLDWTLIPFESLEEVVRVFAFGASKYGKENYQKGEGLSLETYHQSMLRHLITSVKGESCDKESQLDHVAHLAANCLMYLWQKNKNERKFSDLMYEAEELLKRCEAAKLDKE